MNRGAAHTWNSVRSVLWLNFKGKELSLHIYTASPELQARPWVSLPATTGKLTVPKSGYAPAWPQKPNNTLQWSGLCTQTINQHTGKCVQKQKDTRRTLFTTCLQTLKMYTAPLQIIYRVKPAPDVDCVFTHKLFPPPDCINPNTQTSCQVQ